VMKKREPQSELTPQSNSLRENVIYLLVEIKHCLQVVSDP
jgi:hypothetical protein